MDMKRDHYEDIQLFSSGNGALLVRLVHGLPRSFSLWGAVPGKNYYMYMANYVAINIIVAVGLKLLVGYAGQISLGHAGFAFAEPLVAALEAGGPDVTTDKVIAQLNKMKGFKGIFGHITFTAKDHQGQKAVFIAEALKDGRTKKLSGWIKPAK
jgi:branched-chain amino acid transport system permease protein